MPDDKKRYLRLTDYKNRGTILNQVERKFYMYKNDEWVRTGIGLGYFYPDAPEFDCYEEITEEEVMEIVGLI